MTEIVVTSREEFYFQHPNMGLETDTVVVEISDTDDLHCWRLVVNGNPSDWYAYYQGILVWHDYAYATEYWGAQGNGDDTTLPVGVPFRITPCTKAA